MHYGLALPNGGVCGNAATLAEFAALAEASGWDGIFLEDYLVFQNHGDWPACDPWIALTAMALRTHRVRLALSVTPLARRRPWQVARQAVTLDHLSSGRLILGIGLGNRHDVDFNRFGENLDDRARARQLDEALDVLTGLWSGEPFSFHGEHYQIDDVTCLPRPLQQPRIPIWIGGGYPLRGPTERALRWDGSCLYQQTGEGEDWRDWTPDNIRSLKARATSRTDAQTPFDLAPGGRARKDPDADRALIRSLAEAGATWWVEYVPAAERDVMVAGIERGPLRID